MIYSDGKDDGPTYGDKLSAADEKTNVEAAIQAVKA